MSQQLSEEQITEFEKAFLLFDDDGDGAVNKEELGAVMESLGQSLNETELQELINNVDQVDNKIDLSCFLNIMGILKAKDIRVEEDMREVFNVLDIDGSGFISTKELKQVMTDLGDNPSDSEVEELMRYADIDGDGKVSYEEFVTIIKTK